MRRSISLSGALMYFHSPIMASVNGTRTLKVTYTITAIVSRYFLNAGCRIQGFQYFIETVLAG
jgi:hypothetical protein